MDEWLTFMIGIEPDILSKQLNEVSAAFHNRYLEEGRSDYITRQLGTLRWDREISQNVMEATNQSLAELGIDLDIWNSITQTVTDIAPEIGPAFYYFIQSIPQFKNEYPELAQSEIWQNIRKGKSCFLLMRLEANHPEGFRASFHEAGHAIETFLMLNMGKSTAETGFSQNGRPMSLNEIFSLFHESRMPQEDFFKDRERFLTARFAGLTLHELNIWHIAEAFTRGEIELEDFLKKIEDSYQNTFGEGVNSDVPSGRSLSDFFTPYNPLFACGYVYGMVGATALMKYLESGSDDGKSRIEALREIASISLTSETIEEILSAMNYSWQAGTAAMHDYFGLKK